MIDSWIAHEIMRGYSTRLTGLVHELESGALKEATSDIFASMLGILVSTSNLTTTVDDDNINMQSPRQLKQSCTDGDWTRRNAEYRKFNTVPLHLGNETFLFVFE